MSDVDKITPVHQRRAAIVYVRQSSPTQLERNGESTARQYQLVARAVALGWARPQVHIIDEDLGVSANGVAARAGFAQLTTEVALGHVGLVLGLEVSRLARNNADWYRLLDLCGLTGTVLADDDGVYDPSVFNDRLVLGLKGTMSEAELYVLRARLEGGIRHKAARGELRRGLPVGLVWGDAGAYAYGKTRHERYVDATGRVRARIRRLPRGEWAVLIPDHHPGFLSWETYLANQARIGSNTRPQAHQPGGA